MIDSWETPGQAAPAPVDLETREASIRQLAALGYISADAVEGAEAARTADREARFNLATVHLHHGRPEAALPLFQKLCAEAPLETRYEGSRLISLSRLARHAEVIREVERLEAAGCVSAQFDLLAAAASAASGRGHAALDRLNRAAATTPANPAVHQVAGDFHLTQGRPAEAMLCYEEAIRLDPENAPACIGMSQAMFELGDFEGAAESALTSLQQAFWNPVAQFRLGQALVRLGRRTEARRAFEHAVEQAPGFGEAHYRLAAMFEEDGDILNATNHRMRAIGGNPTGGLQ